MAYFGGQCRRERQSAPKFVGPSSSLGSRAAERPSELVLAGSVDLQQRGTRAERLQTRNRLVDHRPADHDRPTGAGDELRGLSRRENSGARADPERRRSKAQVAPASADPDLPGASLRSSGDDLWPRRGGRHRVDANHASGADKGASADATCRQPGQVAPLTLHGGIESKWSNPTAWM